MTPAHRGESEPRIPACRAQARADLRWRRRRGEVGFETVDPLAAPLPEQVKQILGVPEVDAAVRLRFGIGWAKSLTFATDQTLTMQYYRGCVVVRSADSGSVRLGWLGNWVSSLDLLLLLLLLLRVLAGTLLEVAGEGADHALLTQSDDGGVRAGAGSRELGSGAAHPTECRWWFGRPAQYRTRRLPGPAEPQHEPVPGQLGDEHHGLGLLTKD